MMYGVYDFDGSLMQLMLLMRAAAAEMWSCCSSADATEWFV